MSDTAAFFAKKKTKKKKFKSFNANKIDASAVTTSAHVDAPEISTLEGVTTSLGGLGGLGKAEVGGGDDQWADSQGGWGSNNKSSGAAASGGDSKVAELLDMQSLQARRNAEDNVAERLRIEETKAQLAKAKEGMAKEGERLAAEKEAKTFTRAGPAPGARGMGGSTGGKWVPSHMRSTAGGVGLAFSGGGSAIRGAASMEGSAGGGGGFQKPVDMANEELFPDLAVADKIMAEKERLEKEEQDRMAGSKTARAPSGWGSRMGSGGGGVSAAAPAQRKPLNIAPAPAERKPLNLVPPPKKKEEEEKAEETKPEAAPVESPASAPESAAPAVEAPVAEKAAEKPKEKKVLKKKKKKDLSTFKAKS